ncbi:MAG: glycosyltransferase [Phototrophicaceae bacterium]
MSKIILFNIPAAGHVNPSLPIVRELIARGEDVLYINTEDYRQKIEATGASFIAYPDITSLIKLMEEDASEGNLPRNMRDLLRTTAKIMPFCIDLIESQKPDLVIFDTLCRWGYLVAKQTKTPNVSFCTTFVVRPTDMPPLPASAMLDIGSKMLKVLPSYIHDAWTMYREQGIFPGFLLDAVMSTGDITLVFTSRDFQPKGEKYDDSYKFIGTSIATRIDESDFPFDALSDKPMVYISLGTLAQNLNFLKLCFQAFADFDAQFILSAGKQTNLSDLGAIPDNFIVRNFVPQLEILERADTFITHAGMNSVQEGLVYAVPMLAVPHQTEQAFVALRLQVEGAGIALKTSPPFGDVSIAELQTGLRQILANPSYANNAKRLGESLKNAGGYQRAADEIQGFIKRD